MHSREITSKRTRQLFDMDILNMELACKNKVLVLPKMYGTLDSEFLMGSNLRGKMAKCREFDHVRYLHFSGYGKPWQYGDTPRRILGYIQLFDVKVQGLIFKWFQLTSKTCPWMVPDLPPKFKNW